MSPRRMVPVPQRDVVPVQVLMERAAWEAARERAQAMGQQLGPWLRSLMIDALQAPVVGAFGANHGIDEQTLAAWDANKTPHYLLEILPGASAHQMTVRVRKNMGGGVYSDPVGAVGLDDSTPFGARNQDDRILYLKGGDYWKVAGKLQPQTGSCLVFLEHVGVQHARRRR